FLNPNYVLVLFKNILKDIGLPDMRFHDLRHSAATLLLVMVVHPKVVQELLGHSSITITMNLYSHVFPSIQQDAMNKMSNLLSQQEEKDPPGNV
ncbi:MAG: tyrosine-type recombinase/integrase, partial [Ktedonobacteraceae bacterium]|nr:tyrosine-type recombinase/integrase [Ktedonobacteraceae bacterium]